MYRAIIVDDEEAVRLGLRNHFDWAEHGLTVAADFSDGLKAWRYLQEAPVDLVVTDVRMPNMDGISLAKRINESFPRTRVVFISGYDDTESLRKAFKTDAVDYILKSIDLNEFAQTISHVVERLAAETRRQREMEDMEQKLQESIPLLRQRALMLLVSSEYKYAEISRERLKFLRISLEDEAHYCLLVLQIRNLWRTFTPMTERNRQLFSLNLISRAQTVLQAHQSEVVFENHLGEYVIFVNADGEEYENGLLGISEALRRIVEEEMGLECLLGISERFSGMGNAHPAYESAVNAISSRARLTLSISMDKFSAVSARAAHEKAEQAVSEALLSGDMAQVNAAMEGVFEGMNTLPTKAEQQNFLIFLLLLPARVMASVPAAELGIYADQKKLLERFLFCADIREMKLFLLKAYEDAAQAVKNRSEEQPNAIIDRARQLIESTYMEQISIASLAEKVFLTPTYLCVLFKQFTGQTINEYITQVRMQHAKTLLADPGIKLYDVCYQVGYLSPSYFSKVFKKFACVTPSEYRDAHVNRA